MEGKHPPPLSRRCRGQPRRDYRAASGAAPARVVLRVLRVPLDPPVAPRGKADAGPVQLSRSFDKRMERGGGEETVALATYSIIHLVLRAQHGLKSDNPI